MSWPIPPEPKTPPVIDSVFDDLPSVCSADMDCTLDVDITLQSSDCYRYKTHSKNLALYCDAFPAVGSVTIDENEVVQMAESREIVSLLIKFMHRGYQPDLSNVGFETLSALAEAVEKYVVFSAIPVCKAKMRDAIDEHPVEVFLYAIRHGHQELRDLSARETFHIPLLDLARMVGQVAPEACISLMLLRDSYIEPARQLYGKQSPSFRHGCFTSRDILKSLRKQPLSVARFNEVFAVAAKSCSGCRESWVQWKEAIRNRINALPAWVQWKEPVLRTIAEGS